jgi:hypothetical protein
LRHDEGEIADLRSPFAYPDFPCYCGPYFPDSSLGFGIEFANLVWVMFVAWQPPFVDVVVPARCQDGSSHLFGSRGGLMYRHMICALVVSGLAVTMALGQVALPPQPVRQPGPNTPVLRGRIEKIQGNTLYFQNWNPVTKQYGAAVQYQIEPQNFQTFQMNGTNRQVITGGLQSNVFTNPNPQGLFGTLQANGNRASTLTLMNEQALQNFSPNLQVRGRVTKIEGNRVYFAAWNPTTREYGPERAYMVTPENFQAYQMKGANRTVIVGGLTADAFTTIPTGGLYGTLQLQGNRVSSVNLMPQQDMQKLPNANFQGGVNVPGGAGGTGGGR